jgi:hypothetical protein
VLLVAIAFGAGCGSTAAPAAGTQDANSTTQPSNGGSPAAPAGTGAAAGAPGSGVRSGVAGVTGAAGVKSSSGASGASGATATSGASGATATSGASGVGGAPAAAGAVAAGGAGGAIAAGGAGGAAGGDAATATGTFPAVMDVTAAGPYATSVKTGAGTSGGGTVYYPTDFGPMGLKNPIFIWDPGSGIAGTMYAEMLTRLASHGFVAYACASSSATGTEVKDGMDWMIAQDTASGSIFNGKLDTKKVAIGGHSLGASGGVFSNAADARLTTTVMISGGTMDAAHAAVATLKVPALYLCGKTCGGSTTAITDCDLAAPNCTADYGLTKVPVFYGQNDTESHAFGWQMDYGGITAWLRWQLMDDTSQKPMFLGADCGLCKTPWTGMSKGLM